MPTYAVAITRCESATIHVEADNASAAERVALSQAESNEWDADTINTQVDDVSKLDEVTARRVSSYTVREGV